MIGTKLGPYEITAKLGEGGMGEVWRARDTKLERDVAIKVLPPEFVADHERLARFEREAKLLAQLNHPNIAQIYGLEASGDSHALVMELVEGPTLAERLEQGVLPLGESLSLAKQIAEALEEAHEKGIIHRDLKPQNVKASREGKIKVLDFGLAKAMDPGAGSAASASQLAASPTLTLGATIQGVILGTAAYMSPEQAKGFAVDKRADIWAFGVVLFEMLSGRALFAGDSVPDTLARVLQRDVDFEALPETTPAAIRRLLRRCLERAPKNRLHDIADARIVIEEVLSGKTTEVDPVVGEARGGWKAPRVALVAAFTLALGFLSGWWAVGRPKPAPSESPLHLSLVFPEELEVSYSMSSSDGSAVFLAARRRDDPERTLALYRRDVGSEEAVLLRGTERLTGVVPAPDGKSIVFVASTRADSSDRRMMRMPSDGSQPPVEIVRWDPSWTDFNLLANGEPVVIVGSDRLLRLAGGIDPGAGEPVPIEVGRPATFFLGETPSLPDGRLFIGGESWSERGYEQFTALVDPATGKGSVVIPDGGRPQFVAPDRLLYARGSVLLGSRFDPAAGRIVGQPVALFEGMRIGEAWETGKFRLADDGTLAYAPGGLVGAERQFAIFDPANGRVEPWSSERRAFRFLAPQPSPDGRDLYAQLANAAGTYEIWRVPRSGPAQPAVALTRADTQSPILSPDGKLLAFVRVERKPTDGLCVVRTDGAEPLRQLLESPDPNVWDFPTGWTPDGKRILLLHNESGKFNLRDIALDGVSEPRVVAPAPAWMGTISPDGRWLAFVSDASGRGEVYVAAYDPARPIGQRFAVSREGGESPVWSPDGRTLYFNDRGTKILAAAIGRDGRPADEPRVIADREELNAPEEFNVLPDGRLLLLQRGPREGEVLRTDLVLHFDRFLEERLP